MNLSAFFSDRRFWLVLGMLNLGLLILAILPLPTESPWTLTLALGRFHPMLVHFPIVLLLLPLVAEGLITWKKKTSLKPLQPWLIGLGLASALLSAWVGYLLYRSGEYAGELVENHLWIGIGVVLSMSLCAVFFGLGKRKAYLSFLIGSNLLLLIAGHLGGSLTHGSDYLTEHLPKWGTTQAPIEQKPLSELSVYEDVVMAVFEAKCLSCHNEHKAKGGLIMSSFADLQAGGKSKKAMLFPGKPDSSELYHRIQLPADHEDHMPPSGKAPLTTEESRLIRWWIQAGANPTLKVGTEPWPDTVQAALNSYLPRIASRQLTRLEQKAERDAIAVRLIPLATSLGLVAVPDPGADSLLFAIGMQVPPAEITDETLVELLPYAHAISSLSLVSSEITDDGLYTLSHLRHLRQLILAKTCIDGSGLPYLAQLPSLEMLNLTETAVDDAGALNLIKLTSLKSVYVFRAEISDTLVKALRLHLPEQSILLEPGPFF